MRAKEFLTEKFVIKKKIGGIEYGIGDHFMDQWHSLPDRKDITQNEIDRIIKRIPYVKAQLKQMRYFPKFWLRDEETGVELGCRFTDFGDPAVELLYINTLIRRGNERGKYAESPTIIVRRKVDIANEDEEITELDKGVGTISDRYTREISRRALAHQLGNEDNPFDKQCREEKFTKVIGNVFHNDDELDEDVAPDRKEYEFHRDMDTNEFVATWKGEEIGRFKAKSQFDAGEAQDAAKKCISDHFKKRHAEYTKAKDRDVQFNKPLSQLEQEWIALDKKIYDYFHSGGPELTPQEEKRYQQLGPVLRKSLYAINYDDLHPAVKAYKQRK